MALEPSQERNWIWGAQGKSCGINQLHPGPRNLPDPPRLRRPHRDLSASLEGSVTSCQSHPRAEHHNRTQRMGTQQPGYGGTGLGRQEPRAALEGGGHCRARLGPRTEPPSRPRPVKPRPGEEVDEEETGTDPSPVPTQAGPGQSRYQAGLAESGLSAPQSWCRPAWPRCRCARPRLRAPEQPVPKHRRWGQRLVQDRPGGGQSPGRVGSTARVRTEADGGAHGHRHRPGRPRARGGEEDDAARPGPPRPGRPPPPRSRARRQRR